MGEIILITPYESRGEISKTARFLKKRYIRKVQPKNIFIYASSDKKAVITSLIMRDIIKNRIIYNPVCIIDNFLKLLIEPQKINIGIIIIVNPEQISDMINILKNNKIKHNFIRKEIISIQKQFTSR